jgi:hypothetical protein
MGEEMKKNSEENEISIKEIELEKMTKILLREIKERENQVNKSELKKVIKNRVLGSEANEN